MGSPACRRAPVIVLARWLERDLPRKRFTSIARGGHLLLNLPGELTEKEHEHTATGLLARCSCHGVCSFAEFGDTGTD